MDDGVVAPSHCQRRVGDGAYVVEPPPYVEQLATAVCTALATVRCVLTFVRIGKGATWCFCEAKEF